MAAPSRNMPLRSYAISLDLIHGLTELSERDGLSINELVRRAIRRELERQRILPPMPGQRDREPNVTDTCDSLSAD